MSDKVDFLIGGVQKGGTTALHEHLKRDFSVSLASVKEAHFFDDEAVCWDKPDYTAYHALFEPEDNRPRGEATPIYIYWPKALKRIAAYNPAMRLIFVFRHPIERAWSHWRMERGRDYDDAPFSWAIRAGRSRVVDNPETPGAHRVFSYVERGFYGAQLAHALSLFPSEQILALTSDALQVNPKATMTRVADHLKLRAPSGPISSLRANVGEEGVDGSRMNEEDRAYLAELYRADLVQFSALSGLDVAHWMAS